MVPPSVAIYSIADFSQTLTLILYVWSPVGNGEIREERPDIISQVRRAVAMALNDE